MFIDATGNWTRIVVAKMRLRPTIIAYSSILLMMGCAMIALQARAQGTQRSTRAPSSSETNSLEIFKDLNRLDIKEDGLKDLDAELSKSLLPFANRKEMDIVVPPGYMAPRMPLVKSRRSKEELQKSKGWIWDAEEAVSGSMKDESDSLSGPKTDKRKLSWDDFAKQTRRERPDKHEIRSSDRDSEKSDSNSEEDSSLPEGIREVAKGLRSQRDSFGGIFGSRRSGGAGGAFSGQPAESPRSPQQIEAQKTYMDEYQKIIGGGSFDAPITSQGSADFFRAAIAPAQGSPMGGLDSLPASSPRSRPPPAQSLAPTVMSPATLPDVNASVLNQWNPMYTPLKPELPKPAPFFPAPIEIPRRRF